MCFGKITDIATAVLLPLFPVVNTIAICYFAKKECIQKQSAPMLTSGSLYPCIRFYIHICIYVYIYIISLCTCMSTYI